MNLSLFRLYTVTVGGSSWRQATKNTETAARMIAKRGRYFFIEDLL